MFRPKGVLPMESRFDRRELLFQPRGIPPLGTSPSLWPCSIWWP